MIRFFERIIWCIVLAGIGISGYYGYNLWKEQDDAVLETSEYQSQAIDFDDPKALPALKRKNVNKKGNKSYNKCEKIFEMQIPSISKTLTYSILYVPPNSTVSATEKCLKKGPVLMLDNNTVFLGNSGMSLIGGHNETHFRKLQKLVHETKNKNGRPVLTLKKPHDFVILNDGTTRYIYQIRSSRIIHKNTSYSQSYSGPEAKLSLATCYPFDYPTSPAPFTAVFDLELVAKEPGSPLDKSKQTSDR